MLLHIVGCCRLMPNAAQYCWLALLAIGATTSAGAEELQNALPLVDVGDWPCGPRHNSNHIFKAWWCSNDIFKAWWRRHLRSDPFYPRILWPFEWSLMDQALTEWRRFFFGTVKESLQSFELLRAQYGYVWCIFVVGIKLTFMNCPQQHQVRLSYLTNARNQFKL